MKKRILIIDGPLGGGGAERVLVDILNNIDYDRYEVDLALICKGGVLLEQVPAQVNVIGLWDGYSLGYKVALRLSKWLRCNWLLSRKVNGPKLRRDYDLEISFLEGMPLKLGALRTTAARKATWVHADLYTHRYEEGQFFKGEEFAAYNKMDVVVNVSEDCRRAFLKRFGDCTSETRVIYNPIDIAKIKRLGGVRCETNDNILTVTAVGRLTPPKKPLRFAQVAARALAEGLPVRFKWVGDGELRPDLEAEIKRLGIEDRFALTGFLKNPYPEIAASDMLMVTSDFEGFCLVICEAMCLGVPVISTATAGPSEILGDNEFGLLTEISADGLLAALRRMVTDPSLRRHYAQKALTRPDDYAVDKTMRDFYALI